LFKLKNIYLLCLLLAVQANAQSWFSKQWHSSVSHYNYYFNANLLLSDVREETIIAYKDNYKDVLSLYPMLDQASLKGNASKMDEVIKKCSHIIEKHGKGKWVDDAYLLMGDAQLFKGDFYAALEVYEYVAGSFKLSIPAAQAEINLVTTYILMGKFDDAEALYTKLLTKKDFPLELKTQLDIAGAAVNIKQKKYPNAIRLLEAAIPKVKHKLQKVRCNFVLAQLYALNKNNVLASLRYKKVIKLNPPYQFAFNAKLNMAKAINIKNRGEVKNAKLVLRDMLRDDKNIEYFDQIYFELGNLEMADKNEAGAAIEYTNCLRSNGTDLGIKSNAYLALADIYFKKQDYENAQVYYDSAARTIDPTHPDYQKIQNKNLVLNELIKHLVNIKEKDSLLRLADNEKLREKTIDKLIKQEKDKEEQEKFLQESKKNQLNNMDNSTSVVSSTNFPFYNMSSRAKGLQDFNRIWGNRELMDFWAVSSNKSELWKKIDNEQKTNDLGSELKKAAMQSAPNERKKYYENLPFTKLEKQQMKDELAESYFLGANVYYQDLKEFDKAKKMLEELNAKYPDNKFQINAWYLLGRIAQDQKNLERANYFIELIRKQDPQSNFLNVLLNHDQNDSIVEAAPAEDVVEILYSKAYTSFKAKKYEEAMKYKAENDLKFPGNPLQVNFDYIEALILGEQGQFKPFQVKLQAIADNYPNSPIAKQAMQTIDLLKIKSGETVVQKSSDKYTYNPSADQFYMLLVPKNTDMTPLKIAYLNYNKSYFANEGLKVTTSLLGDQYQILIVNNFKGLDVAKNYLIQMRSNPNFFSDLKITDSNLQYLISKENFTVLITERLISDYELFFKTNYTF
jgi:tetratricopeptide (TPR) repeat protein